MATLDNLIEVKFTKTEINKLNKGLDLIEQALDGKMINLTPQQRIKFRGISNGRETWVRKIKDYMDQEPQLTPFYIKKEAFDIDFEARNILVPGLLRLASITESMEDTVILLGHDIYTTSLAYYNHIKLTSKQNVPGSSTIYKDLAAQFKVKTSSSEE